MENYVASSSTAIRGSLDMPRDTGYMRPHSVGAATAYSSRDASRTIELLRRALDNVSPSEAARGEASYNLRPPGGDQGQGRTLTSTESVRPLSAGSRQVLDAIRRRQPGSLTRYVAVENAEEGLGAVQASPSTGTGTNATLNDDILSRYSAAYDAAMHLSYQGTSKRIRSPSLTSYTLRSPSLTTNPQLCAPIETTVDDLRYVKSNPESRAGSLRSRSLRSTGLQSPRSPGGRTFSRGRQSVGEALAAARVTIYQLKQELADRDMEILKLQSQKKRAQETVDMLEQLSLQQHRMLVDAHKELGRAIQQVKDPQSEVIIPATDMQRSTSTESRNLSSHQETIRNLGRQSKQLHEKFLTQHYTKEQWLALLDSRRQKAIMKMREQHGILARQLQSDHTKSRDMVALSLELNKMSNSLSS
ncbi:hypothetical protein GMRT_14193 [Giardia muris]|uniref:Uncharacterized protein n=1 Tax=Giardia muris TaxID=5742 RepID=A0A4Z1T3P1_GIAMU|nr:hypothetical protein GMRT_14193 [Giardia muris]|eukprot:TNJ30268.1 hypothetical protein GMRT_14193 [Giardia muris]